MFGGPLENLITRRWMQMLKKNYKNCSECHAAQVWRNMLFPENSV